MTLVDRPLYTRRIEPLVDAPVVKVLTGLRRSGKSGLLALTADLLRNRGVSADRIVFLNFDELENAPLASAAALDAHIRATTPADGQIYVLLDEVQEVDQWERLVNSLQASGRADVYITGSNARLLSGELATYIAGRYVTLTVQTLSFAEYLSFVATYTDRDTSRTSEEFARYLRLGGFPATHVMPFAEPEVRAMVGDIYRSTLIRDVLSRHEIRDTDMFERVAAFALDNVGNLFSARRVADFMKSEHRAVNHQTVLNYLTALAEAFVLTRVRRFDVRGRRLLASDEKLFVGDHGLVHALFGYNDQRLPGVLENIVWAELVRRGYDVTIGKVGAQEIDFVATTGDERLYVQVTTSLTASDQTRRREVDPLLAVRDAYPKMVLSMDTLAGGSVDGVRHVWLPQWLLAG